jgi:hypothetical protein
MVYSQNQVENYARTIRISLTGKSSEAQSGARLLINDLLRYAKGLKEEDRTFDAMMEMLHKLNKVLPN